MPCPLAFWWEPVFWGKLPLCPLTLTSHFAHAIFAWVHSWVTYRFLCELGVYLLTCMYAVFPSLHEKWFQDKESQSYAFYTPQYTAGLCKVCTEERSVELNSVAQSFLTLCDPMNRSTPGLPVHHQLPESAQTYVHWVGDAIQPSHPVVPFSCPQSLQASGSFPMSQLFAWGGRSIGVSASGSVVPMNTEDWSPLGWTGWISLQSKGLSRVFSNTTQFKSINFLALSFLHSPTLTFIRDHWKNHSLDQTDLCWQSNVSAF